MVDEFQDTDPVQWKVIDRAFSGRSTLILIGDPKQAIYAFRGGDIVTYLQAAETAGAQKTLGTNWRSDAALVDRLQAVLRGAELGDARIIVHDVEAHHQAPAGRAPRATTRSGCASCAATTVRPQRNQDDRDRRSARTHPARPRRRHRRTADQRRHLRRHGRCEARDIAVIVESHKDARACYRALGDAGIPAVYTGDSDIFSSDAADDWLCLLEAFDQPHRAGLVRAAAATMFFGKTADDARRTAATR